MPSIRVTTGSDMMAPLAAVTVAASLRTARLGSVKRLVNVDASRRPAPSSSRAGRAPVRGARRGSRRPPDAAHPGPQAALAARLPAPAPRAPPALAARGDVLARRPRHERPGVASERALDDPGGARRGGRRGVAPGRPGERGP